MNMMIVEDDDGLRKGIPLALAKEEDCFFCCSSLSEARKVLDSQPIDMIILDIGLPDGDGLEFCREIRRQYDMPVLFLTANDMEYDEVAGLNAGADDYITKPFSLAVLRSRIEALRRRWEGFSKKNEKDSYQIGPFRFCFSEQKFYREQEEIILSKIEQKLLKILVENEGQVLPREVLLERVWGIDSAFMDENALSVAVGRLRSKLSGPKEGTNYIKTVYGVGYKWETI